MWLLYVMLVIFGVCEVGWWLEKKRKQRYIVKSIREKSWFGAKRLDWKERAKLHKTYLDE